MTIWRADNVFDLLIEVIKMGLRVLLWSFEIASICYEIETPPAYLNILKVCFYRTLLDISPNPKIRIPQIAEIVKLKTKLKDKNEIK